MHLHHGRPSFVRASLPTHHSKGTACATLLWQLMRVSCSWLTSSVDGGGGDDEDAVLRWAVERVGRVGGGAGAAAAPKAPLSLRDPALATSHFLLHLLYALDPRIVNWAMVAPLPCVSRADCTANAQYALSVARRYGASVFLIHEDVSEVNARMLSVLLACIVHRAATVEQEGR